MSNASERQGPGLVVAVVGATGLVGRTMIQILEERNFPVAELRPLAASASGRSVRFRGAEIPVAEAMPDAFEGVDIALFSAGAGASLQLAPEAAKRGCTVVDNSSAWRMDPTVPLVVSQVNPEALDGHQGIIANPNCSTMQLAPLLHALQQAAGLRRVVVATYQAVSGAGGDSVEDLRAQQRALVAGETPASTTVRHAVVLSPIPAIDIFLPDGSTKEETKVVNESRKILSLPALRISATAVRVPVEVGHSEAVHVELERPLSPESARTVFAQTAGVFVQDDPATHTYPLAAEAAGSDGIFVGRVRVDQSVENGLAFWVVSDNVRKGAATNAVEIAELLVARRLLHE
ncbi:MAG: aspartate-semialdehyde dehydrogenase [Chloroflexi bacterium]|nr:MAG: aspartate-semialdehyde dehydrogenase [Chloroflexota bacterium]